jgi:hypothetical protein
MSIGQRWRFFWARRSTTQRLWALALGLSGLCALALAALPDQWWNTLAGSLAMIGAMLAPHTPSWFWPVLGAGALVACALMLLIAFPRRFPFFSPAPGAVAKISVYVDGENQALPPQHATRFFERLDEHLRGRHADLVYFTDVGRISRENTLNPQGRIRGRLTNEMVYERYREFYRRGFRSLSVPQRIVDDEHQKKVVDAEMSLYAYQRALFGPPHQEIHLVTADQDFAPLVIRLCGLKHSVHIWGRRISQTLQALASEIEVTIHRLDEEEVDRQARDIPVASWSASAVQQPPTEQKAQSSTSGLSAEGPPPVGETAATALSDTIADTLSRLHAVSVAGQTPADRYGLLVSDLEKEDARIYTTLRYRGKNRAATWIRQLTTLGALRGDESQSLLVPGSKPPAQAAEALIQVFQRAAAVAREQAHVLNAHEVSVSHLWQAIRMLPDDGQSDIIALKHLGKKQLPYLYRGAHVLGILSCKITLRQNGLTIVLAG